MSLPTVINCFGVVSADDNETEDPFGELDEHIDITELNSLVQYVCPNSTVTEYLDTDQDLSVSFTIDPEEMETEQWRDRLRQEALAICKNEVPCSEDEESDNKLEITEVEENCITTTRQAIKCVENLQSFFAKNEDEQPMISMGQVLNPLQDNLWKETKQTKQSTMFDYFEHI